MEVKKADMRKKAIQKLNDLFGKNIRSYSGGCLVQFDPEGVKIQKLKPFQLYIDSPSKYPISINTNEREINKSSTPETFICARCKKTCELLGSRTCQICNEHVCCFCMDSHTICKTCNTHIKLQNQ